MRTHAEARRTGHRRLIALMASALVVAAACGSSTPTPAPGVSGAPVSSADPSGAAGTVPAASVSPAPPAAEVPSSSSLIEAAEQAGTIDHDTALVYHLYSALDYASLPAAYQSDDPASADATRILAELSLRSAQLSPDLQAKVAPFLTRPTDPASIWAKRLATARGAAGAVLAASTTWSCAEASGISWSCVDTASAPVRVWYNALWPATIETARALAAEIDRSGMWATEKASMLGHTPCTDAAITGEIRESNGGDGRLDIYVVSTGRLTFAGREASLQLRNGSTANGVAVPEATDTCGAIPFVVVNASQDPEDLASTTAHELFHAFQFSFRNSLESNRNWWAEASATWAKDLVYPAGNQEQGYLDGYWSRAEGAEGPLDRFEYGRPPQYAAYLWAFYLRQKLGSANGSIIGQVWKASETEDPIHAIEALAAWPDMFKEFAIWNWNNDDPKLIRYKDEPDGVIPSTVLTQLTSCMSGDGCETKADGSSRSLLANGIHTAPIDARYTSVQYLAASPEVDVGALRFDLREVQAKRGIGIQAILWIGDAPAQVRVEDWSDRAERRFCTASEDVRKVVLVVTNSAVDPIGDFRGAITVDATADGCPPVTTSTATYTKDSRGVGSHTWSKLSMAVTSQDGRTTATVDYEWNYVDQDGTQSIRGSGTVDAYLVCSMAADGTVGIEAGWSDAVPSTQTNWGGSGKTEASYLEFMGFIFEARGDPNAKGTSGSKTEDDSSADGVNVAVYTWDCPNPDRRP